MSGVEVASATARIRKLTELNCRDLAGKIACVRVDGTSSQVREAVESLREGASLLIAYLAKQTGPKENRPEFARLFAGGMRSGLRSGDRRGSSWGPILLSSPTCLNLLERLATEARET